MAWHDANLALIGSNDTRAVWTNHTHALTVYVLLGVKHIDGRDPFGNTDNQLNTRIRGLKDGILTERCRHINNACFRTGLLDRFTHGVKYRQAEVFCTTLTRADTAHHLSAVVNGLLRVEGTLRAGKALTDYFGVFVDQDAHDLPPAALTTCCAASDRLVAAMMFKPLSAST